jgi:hypothetical protein
MDDTTADGVGTIRYRIKEVGQDEVTARIAAAAVGENPSYGEPVDADYVIQRLEEAGATLLALPGTGWSTQLRSSSIEIVRTAIEAYGWHPERVRPVMPAAEKITRMDEAFAWLTLIPNDRYILRRVIGARSLVHPVTARHLFPWRRIGAALGADHKAIQRWHALAIDQIVACIQRSAAA